MLTSGQGEKQCSGVLLDRRWVLTAAHCVTGPQGNPHNPAYTQVRLGNNQYHQGGTRSADIIALDGVPWNGRVRRDYALVRLTLGVGNQNMWLANVSNSTILNHDAYNLGYPFAVGHYCSANNNSDNPLQHLMYRQQAAVTGVTTHLSTGRGLVKTRLDTSFHQSGSPMFYCPEGRYSNHCESGDDGYVVGVLSAYNFEDMDVRGPKVPGRLRNWAIGFLPNH